MNIPLIVTNVFGIIMVLYFLSEILIRGYVRAIPYLLIAIVLLINLNFSLWTSSLHSVIQTLNNMYIELKPVIDPRLSCPQSVLYLPIVLEGIKKGEIVIRFVAEEGDETLVAELLIK